MARSKKPKATAVAAPSVTPTQINTERALAPHIAPRSLANRFYRAWKATWWILLAALFLLMIGVAGEAVHHHFTSSPTIGHVSQELLSRIFSWGYTFHFVSEIGVAFFIAWIVAVFIEARARDEQTDAFRAAIHHIGHSVLEGVYGIRHDEAYVKAVISRCLAINYVRKNVHIFYKVTELTPAECRRLGVSETDYLRVRVEFSYDTVNITERPGTFEGVYTIPMRLGELGKLAKLNSLIVDGRDYAQEERDDAEVAPDSPHYHSSDRTWSFDIPTIPNRRTPVLIRSEFVKERSDTEIFAFLLPTMDVIIRFDFQVDGLVQIDAKARTATSMIGTPSSQGHDREWSIVGSILPNDYVAVWWVTDPDYITARKSGKSASELAPWVNARSTAGSPPAATESVANGMAEPEPLAAQGRVSASSPTSDFSGESTASKPEGDEDEQDHHGLGLIGRLWSWTKSVMGRSAS